MTLDEYNLLGNDEQRLAAVLLNGECVGMRDENDQKVVLYQLTDFYVEFYSKNKEGDCFRAFTSLEPLKPYLEEIDISSLIK